MISIIMGVYNGADTLREALDSIIGQSCRDWEFVICDDCSTDGSMDILREYAQADHRFILIRNERNRGLAFSLNHCMEYAHGDFIARMDCDDISLPDRLDKQLAFLRANPRYDLVGTWMQGFDANGLKQVITKRQDPTKEELPLENPFHHATILMRSEVLRALNGYTVSDRTRRLEDMELWYRFFSAGYRGTTLPEPLYLVRLDRNAYKRRKLKYALDASAIMWDGITLLGLPFRSRAYCLKPVLSWLLPHRLKDTLRGFLHRSDSGKEGGECS